MTLDNFVSFGVDSWIVALSLRFVVLDNLVPNREQ